MPEYELEGPDLVPAVLSLITATRVGFGNIENDFLNDFFIFR